jgi:acetyl-CoA C-acetyltransferase
MTARRTAAIVAARRTAVAPRGGALKALQADELAAPVLRQLLEDAGVPGERVDHVILGNALYGGGNPARLAALRAGLPVSVPALTVDTQCCSGLDAILLGVRLIESGAAECVLAGGTESFSRAPIRRHRPKTRGEAPVTYDRPPFAPPPFADPDLADAAARLAAERGITREAQAAYAVASHQKALSATDLWLTRLAGTASGLPDRDTFNRNLTAQTAMRAPVIAGDRTTGLGAATIACEADAAAAVLLMPEDLARTRPLIHLNVTAAVSTGGDPGDPALVPVAAARKLMSDLEIAPGDLAAVELMEAYAVQAMATAADLDLDPGTLNRQGGALARGHPIGASGAILAVNLFECMPGLESPAEGGRMHGLALIAAAGGLAAAMLVTAVSGQGR